jgi:hypothetical protein
MSFFISPQLYDEILQAAGEIDSYRRFQAGQTPGLDFITIEQAFTDVLAAGASTR